MRDTFSSYHPIINFTYFCGVIFCAMIFLHPAALMISMAGALAYALNLYGGRGLRLTAVYLLPMMVIAALVNPLFNHRGMTILGYLRGNPITLESILYGAAVGFMFGTVILWFSCYNKVMTSDKFLYLFGKVIPAMSLIFSMVLRFVPRFQQQTKVISNGRKCIGKDVKEGSLRKRLRNGVKILSVMISWSLENSIETADSMRSRGYGLPGRTTFSIYRFDTRDKAALTVLCLLFLVIAAAGISGQSTIQYFPSIKTAGASPVGILGFSAYFLLCFAPVMINFLEELRWRHLQSKI